MSRMTPRSRHYLPRPILAVARPLFRYSYARDAFILRFVGESHGPVLRQNLRRRQRDFSGPDRRRSAISGSALVGR